MSQFILGSCLGSQFILGLVLKKNYKIEEEKGHIALEYAYSVNSGVQQEGGL